jgi:hypothetical protein
VLAAQRAQAPLEPRVQPGAGHDEAVLAQRLEPHLGLEAEPVAAPHQHAHPLVDERAPHEARHRVDAEADRDVEPAAEQLAAEVAGRGLRGVDLDAGMELAQPREQRGPQLMAGRGRAPEPQRAEHAAARARRARERCVDRLQRGSAVGQQPPARLGELHVARRADEQLDAELVLELADRRAQRRRGHVQAIGRPREVQLLGDRDEIAQVAQLGHGCGGS